MKAITNLLSLGLFLLLTVPLKAQVDYEKIKINNLNIGNALFWTTNSEQNNASFLIEKSTNGKSYTPIFEVAGAGNSTEPINYSHIDVKANESVAYYRIKQIALDGTYSYSKVIEVQQKHPNNLSIERFSDLEDQRFKGYLHVFLSSAKTGLLNYSIENEAIGLKDEFEQMLQEGSNQLTMDFSFLPRGNYVIEMVMEGEKELLLIEKVAEPVLQVQVIGEDKLVKQY